LFIFKHTIEIYSNLGLENKWYWVWDHLIYQTLIQLFKNLWALNGCYLTNYINIFESNVFQLSHLPNSCGMMFFIMDVILVFLFIIMVLCSLQSSWSLCSWSLWFYFPPNYHGFVFLLVIVILCSTTILLVFILYFDWDSFTLFFYLIIKR
jgi:hypothetical protein